MQVQVLIFTLLVLFNLKLVEAASKSPTKSPSKPPSKKPTISPSRKPTLSPSKKPTLSPSKVPTGKPNSAAPSKAPSKTPTFGPTFKPSLVPSRNPSGKPTSEPTSVPSTKKPSISPSLRGTSIVSSKSPSLVPTKKPSYSPTARFFQCRNKPNLMQVMKCFKLAIQPSGSNLYKEPSQTVKDQFYSLIQDIVNQRSCNINLLSQRPDLASKMTISPYDEANQPALNKYCLVYEYLDSNADNKFDDGFGVFIINLASDSIPLGLSSPHSLFDGNTSEWAISNYRSLNARFFSVNGAHRLANSNMSTCQTGALYGQADVVHNTNNLYFTFYKALYDLEKSNPRQSGSAYSSVYHIDFHGMGSTTCSGVDSFVSSGFSTAPKANSKAYQIQNAMLLNKPSWVVKVVGDTAPTCTLYGSENVVGRLLNGVSADLVCTTKATVSPTIPKFTHIETKANNRLYLDWLPSLMSVIWNVTSL